jgi:hypothetical protein
MRSWCVRDRDFRLIHEFFLSEIDHATNRSFAFTLAMLSLSEESEHHNAGT